MKESFWGGVVWLEHGTFIRYYKILINYHG